MKNLLFVIITLLAVNGLFAQSQAERLSMNTIKGKSWIGLEIEKPDIFKLLNGNYTVRPSINYHYFIKNRLSVFGALQGGIPIYDQRFERTTDNFAWSVGTRWYPFKKNGFFGELEYKQLTKNGTTAQFPMNRLHDLGLDIGWSIFLGKKNNVLLEVQQEIGSLRIRQLSALPGKTTVGVKFLLGNQKKSTVNKLE